MSNPLKFLFLVMLAIGILSGFLHLLIPPDQYNFERLHIFLFNLCSGGTLILYFSENRKELSLYGRLFLFLAIGFALSSFFNITLAAMILPWPLAVLVETVRYKTFGQILPSALFSATENIGRKFHQASLLCLSCALIFSSVVLYNKQFGTWTILNGFSLNTFYLAFSFPVSLISLAVVFTQIDSRFSGVIQVLSELSFWGINLGVILFFLLILGHLYVPQMAIATLLFLLVLLILFVYLQYGSPGQQKNFLTSGIFFLLITSISGISYIFLKYSGGFTQPQLEPLLRLHTFTSLYGWNLSGLLLICRRQDFPIQLNSKRLITLHWLTVLVLCPLGYFSLPFAGAAIVLYVIFLYQVFFAESTPVSKTGAQNRKAFI